MGSGPFLWIRLICWSNSEINNMRQLVQLWNATPCRQKYGGKGGQGHPQMAHTRIYPWVHVLGGSPLFTWHFNSNRNLTPKDHTTTSAYQTLKFYQDDVSVGVVDFLVVTLAFTTANDQQNNHGETSKKRPVETLWNICTWIKKGSQDDCRLLLRHA